VRGAHEVVFTGHHGNVLHILGDFFAEGKIHRSMPTV
jgi:hypothetical protein